MSKTNNQKLTPTVANILAGKIVQQIKDENMKIKKDVKTTISKQMLNDPEIKKGNELVKQLVVINNKLNRKYEKYISGKKCWFSEGQFKAVSDYWWKTDNQAPSIEMVKNELLLESFFQDGVNPEQIITQYVKKYTK